MYPLALTTVTLLTHLTTAQSTNSTSTTCPNQDRLISLSSGSVNATGSTRFTYTNSPSSPFYLSILVNNTASSPAAPEGKTIAWPYLSVPGNANANVCVYSFATRNATTTGAACEGVLSEKCKAHLRQALMASSSRLGSEEARCSMPDLSSSAIKEREEACGKMGNIGLNSWRNISNSTCTPPSLPGVELPAGYVTHSVGISLSPFAGAPVTDEWDGYADMAYDLSLMQSTPYAVVASFEGRSEGAVQRDVEFVCVTPNKTEEGSRAVGDETPWEEEDSGSGDQTPQEEEKNGAWRAVPGWLVAGSAMVGALILV